MKVFYVTAERVLRVQSGNPVVRSVNVDEQLICDRDQVDAAIAKYFKKVYGSEDQDQHMETEEDLTIWSRFEAAVEATQGMFTPRMNEAIKTSIFNNKLCPDGFDGKIL